MFQNSSLRVAGFWYPYHLCKYLFVVIIAFVIISLSCGKNLTLAWINTWILSQNTVRNACKVVNNRLPVAQMPLENKNFRRPYEVKALSKKTQWFLCLIFLVSLSTTWNKAPGRSLTLFHSRFASSLFLAPKKTDISQAYPVIESARTHTFTPYFVGLAIKNQKIFITNCCQQMYFMQCPAYLDQICTEKEKYHIHQACIV